MREDDIRFAIENMEGGKFERFSRELLSREMYPGLNPTSRTHDLGEDARTEPTTLFSHNGKWISLAISKESGWDKLRGDCDRCQETGRTISTLVFVTAGAVRSDVVEIWKIDVKRKYGWDLEVRTIEFLSPYASRPQFESLVDDYIFIPPPGGDYIQDIETKFSRHTARYLAHVNDLIPGMSTPLPRNEVIEIEELLSQRKNVVLTGEAGTGKSGIAGQISKNALDSGKIVLIVDARRIGKVQTEGELRVFLT